MYGNEAVFRKVCGAMLPWEGVGYCAVTRPISMCAWCDQKVCGATYLLSCAIHLVKSVIY